jgi:uncharacterized protein (TIGR03118 family)
MTHSSGSVVGKFLVIAALASATVTASAQFFDPFSVKDYEASYLVSDVPGLAAFTDASLVGAWGVTHSATSPWWVNSTMSGKSLLFNGEGEAFPTNNPLEVTVPPAPSSPTGIVFNGAGGFNVESNKSSVFLFATLNGSISGWNPTQSDPSTAIAKITDTTAEYTGLTIVPLLNGSNVLYAADFAKNQIDGFDESFTPVTLASNAFVDEHIPTNLSVFNVLAIHTNYLFVTYAPPTVFSGTNLPGSGEVAVFSPDGKLLGHLEHGPWMNAPWGVAMGDADNGLNGPTIFVGMFGSGRIATFGPRGEFRGMVTGTDRRPITLGNGAGLWGIGFGNGANAGPADTLYFATDLVESNSLHGIFGALTPVARHHHHGGGDGDGNGEGNSNGNGDGDGNGNGNGRGHGHSND